MNADGGNPGSGVEGGTKAAALEAGSPIGPSEQFETTQGPLIERVKYGSFFFCTTRCFCRTIEGETGNWLNVSGYLGLEFQINGLIHYGWAAINVEFDPSKPELTGSMTGYAYETSPGVAIDAGQTQ